MSSTRADGTVPSTSTGWFATAPFLGCYSKDVQSGEAGVGAAVKGWAVGIPVRMRYILLSGQCAAPLKLGHLIACHAPCRPVSLPDVP